ncbi:MAG: hypothetical protein HY714_00590 [Candidatus Omnitrophica bacterium]|nr:hypothetical protein [Candidatus Omnitrophota bacterium]
MKTHTKIAVLLILALIAAVPAFAAAESSIAVEGKTLADFQREYAGTKPVVAWHKFQEYQLVGSAPRPTLSVNRIRLTPEEMTSTEFARGTKPAVGVLIKSEAERAAARPKTLGAVEIAAPDQGTKPVLGMLKRG